MAKVLIGSTPTEIPKGSATTVTIQNQSSTHMLILTTAASTPATTAGGPEVEPKGWNTVTPGSDTIYGWFVGEPTSHQANVYYQQEA